MRLTYYNTKKLFKHFVLFIICIFFLQYFAFAKIILPPFFGNNMVLQQKTEAAIWGIATNNSTVVITTSWNKKRYNIKADATGNWKTKIATPNAGGPFEISIKDEQEIKLQNILIGEVWLCIGQSNMEMPMKGFKDQPILGSNDAIFESENDNLRLFIVPRSVKLHPQDTIKNSTWKAANAESVSNFSAAAYYFAKILQKKLKVPIGLINVSYGGSPAEAFMDDASLKEFSDIKLPTSTDSLKLNNKFATVLYNGMLKPVMGYTIKGCIWYQGESNYERPDQYEKLFPAMVKFWRTSFGQGDFPFYYAQIAPYKYATLPNAPTTEKMNSAYLRDAQRKALAVIPNSGMIVLTDAGEEKSIHPANKEIVGKRFAYYALAKTYEQKGFGYASPSLDSLLIKDSIATIKFTNVPNGLTSFGKPITNFEIAGADKVFYPALAKISGGKILLNNNKVPKPVAVRFAFKDFVIAELFSTEGFPVSSFRTDDW
jgi:sialate O-acetylesterase